MPIYHKAGRNEMPGRVCCMCHHQRGAYRPFPDHEPKEHSNALEGKVASEVVLVTGERLRIGAGFDASLLRQVLAALRA